MYETLHCLQSEATLSLPLKAVSQTVRYVNVFADFRADTVNTVFDRPAVPCYGCQAVIG